MHSTCAMHSCALIALILFWLKLLHVQWPGASVIQSLSGQYFLAALFWLHYRGSLILITPVFMSLAVPNFCTASESWGDKPGNEAVVEVCYCILIGTQQGGQYMFTATSHDLQSSWCAPLGNGLCPLEYKISYKTTDCTTVVCVYS